MDSRSPTLDAAERELRRGISGLLGTSPGTRLKDGAIVLSTRQLSGASEGYCIRSTDIDGHRVTVISGNRDIGVLYGAFELLRLIQTRTLPARVDVCDSPKIPIRVLDHWDNLDGTIERGYAGRSLWNWERLPTIDPRLIDYARANASIGINGAVLNNVNADARILTPEYLRKVAAIADAWRPYNIRVYLSARFSAPMEIGGLQTADPLDPGVRDWWRAKIDEIHRLIPDFGGFVVKANAEGQPGPQTYGRTHADGANMLADALAAHHGIVFWRAFVYSDASEEDRAKQAYDEFKPLDGKFRSNVILQIKNGPIDFQPREPFHPLFGAMSRTHLAIEVQITKEYLGESTHLAYLGTMWSEVLRSRTARPQHGSRVVDSLSAIAGVANVGSERNWTGSDFDQANWYAFGRLAWNPSDDPGRIADQWTRMTWSNDPQSREAGGRDHDEIPPGGRRYHDSARSRASDGERPSLRSRPMGERSSRCLYGTRPITTAQIPAASGSTALPPEATPSPNMRLPSAAASRTSSACPTTIFSGFTTCPGRIE